MRLLLALPLLVLPGAQTAERAENSHDAAVVRAELVSAEHESSIETAKNMWGIATAPTSPQDAPAAPEAPAPHPLPESTARAEPVAAPELSYHGGKMPPVAQRTVFAPTPETAIVIRSEQPPSGRKHSRGYYERAAARCEKRATEFARKRCLERVASE